MKQGKRRSIRVAGQLERSRKQREAKAQAETRRRRAPVNTSLLGPNPSVGLPEFAVRGYYEDLTFQCKDCGKQEVWRAMQQKWWYEIAKGNVWTTAVRCRLCRRKERMRRTQARAEHMSGLIKKARRNV